MTKELALTLIGSKDVYLTPEGMKLIESMLIEKEADFTDVQTDGSLR